jgi:hypothetical protein
MSDYPDDIAESTRIIGKRPGREEPTRRAEREDRLDRTDRSGPPPRQARGDATELITQRTGGGGGGGTGGGTRYEPVNEEPSTQVLGRPGSADRTRLFGQGEMQGAAGDADAMADPVVAWLVVVDGPGRGSSITLGYGQNSIGRGQSERVRIDFGDTQISRENHCFIIYEPNDREFTVLRGTGKGLSYLNQKVIIEPRPIRSGELLRVGATTLRFMAFCGPDYDWQDGPLPAAKANPGGSQADPGAASAPGV